MPSFVAFSLFSITALFTYIWSFSPLSYLTPQLIALLIILGLLNFRHRPLYFHLSLVGSITLLIFTAGSLQSPFFFLAYFLLFFLSFQYSPFTTMSLSLILVFLFSFALNSPASSIPLISLLLTSPLTWFISFTQKALIADETDTLLWISLRFKHSVSSIIDSASLLLSNPSLTPPQKQELNKIKDTAASLLKSASQLQSDIDHNSDEI